MNKRSMVMETNSYTNSRRYFQNVSSKPNFISRQFNLSATNIVCQFSHLILYYILTSLLNMCNHIYYWNEAEMNTTIAKWKEKYWVHTQVAVDVTNPISKKAQNLPGRGSEKSKDEKGRETKPREIVKISEEEINDKQYAFLQSML